MARPFDKVLVANRGEIARRVFRTCRERDIATVAVYSDADAHAAHVADADEAYAIGPAEAAQSYLVVEKIIDAAQRSGAQAIHPGYGFLSERAALVEACDAAGITFIGPPTEAMRVMGDKVSARKAMVAAGVPVIPGVDDVADADAALAVADGIGLPVMLKASAGGGGKGMRIVHNRDGVRAAFDAASREAAAGVRGRTSLRRARGHPGSPRGDSGDGGSPRGLRVFGRARLLGAASSPKGHRRGAIAQSADERRGSRRDGGGRHAGRRCGGLRRSGYRRVSLRGDRRWSALLFPGDEHAAPGRASRDRGHHRP